MELKDKLDDLNEGYTKSAYANKFLTNITDHDYAEDARALECAESFLDSSIKAIRRVQRKLNLEREKHRLAKPEIIQ